MATEATKSSATKALYRKYRPTRLQDVIGEEQVTVALDNAIKGQKIGHAYLFIGPRGTGKTSVARIFAHAVNGFDYQVEDDYLDIIEIDAASNTGVDNIRELREKAIIAPTKGKYKVYIIDEVHMLTKSAANALLKTLEEPPAHVIFIMATTDAHKVPITISSRTQVHQFKLADDETMFAHLQKIAKQEGIKITDEALKIVVYKGGGSFRDSLSILDQVATLSDGEITDKIIEQMLGLPDEQKLTAILQSYRNHDHAAINASLRDLFNSGITAETITSDLIAKIVKNPEPILIPLLEKLTAVGTPFAEAKLLIALLAENPTATPESSLANAKTTKNPTNDAETATVTTVSPTATQDANSTSNQSKKSGENPENRVLPPQNTPEATPDSKEPVDGTQTAKTPQSASERLRAKMAARNRERAAAKKAGIAPNGANNGLGADSLASSTPQPAPTLNHFSVENFNWQTLLSTIELENSTVYHNLSNSDYDFKDSVLHVYPLNKFAKNLLEQEQNFATLKKYLEDTQIIIHEPGSKIAEDPQISQISAIMGNVQEVKETDKNMPF